MPSTLSLYAPFDAGAGANVTEDMWRRFMKNNQGGSGVLRGILSDFAVFADTTGMQVKVQSGECWIQGHWGTNTATATLPIAAAHATLARKDRVILRADFTNNRVELDVLTGTAAASPTVPALTQNTSIWETSLALVDIPAADTTIDAGQVTRGHYVDFTSSFTKYRRASGSTQSIPTDTLTKIQFPTAVDNLSAAVTVSGTNNNTFTLNRAGEWTITATASYESTGNDFDGSRWLIIADATNGTTTRYTADVSNAIGTTAGLAHLGGMFNCSVTERFSAGASISAWAFQNSGSSLNLTSLEDNLPTTISLRWNGW